MVVVSPLTDNKHPNVCVLRPRSGFYLHTSWQCVTLSTFSRTHWPFTGLHLKNEIIYFFAVNPVSNVWPANIFFHWEGCLFSLLLNFIAVQKNSGLAWCCFCFCCCFGYKLRQTHPLISLRKCAPVISSNNFSCLKVFTSFWMDVHCFVHGYQVFLIPLTKETLLSLLCVCGILLKDKF